ncbi:hypothetical protein [Winogradskyella poriferorum]|uniref:hypothetical protein n=1 Tax=Winogradskyella poriferorum TaxID=307627 RepID=UPI003D65AA94
MRVAYYKLAILPDELKVANKIRSKARLDCISFTDQTEDGYNGLTNFVNHKGQLFFYKTPCKDFVQADKKRLAEWSLTNNGLNLSSIYIDDLDYPEIGYGYPNANRLLSNGSKNPLFEFRNDGYLFLMNKDYSVIELLIIPDGRNLISSYYQKLIDGGFDNEIRKLREQSIEFYQYGGLLL